MVFSGNNKLQGNSCHMESTGSLVITRCLQMISKEMKIPFSGKSEELSWKYEQSEIKGSCRSNAAMIESLRRREGNSQIPSIILSEGDPEFLITITLVENDNAAGLTVCIKQVCVLLGY